MKLHQPLHRATAGQAHKAVKPRLQLGVVEAPKPGVQLGRRQGASKPQNSGIALQAAGLQGSGPKRLSMSDPDAPIEPLERYDAVGSRGREGGSQFYSPCQSTPWRLSDYRWRESKGLPAHKISGNVRPIGDHWAIESGRYPGIGLMNQWFLSTTGNKEWAIDPLTMRRGNA